MIKAYFLDWMDTLGNVNNENVIGALISREIHHSLLTQKFENADIPKTHRERIYQYLMTTKLNLYPDSEPAINILKEMGYKLAIVSDMYNITAKRIRELYQEFLGKFNVVTLSSEIGYKKPQSRIFLHTFNRLNALFPQENILLEEVMMIGDLQNKDIDPALKLGMQARLIDRTKGQTLIDFIG